MYEWENELDDIIIDGSPNRAVEKDQQRGAEGHRRDNDGQVQQAVAAMVSGQDAASAVFRSSDIERSIISLIASPCGQLTLNAQQKNTGTSFRMKM